MIRKLNAYGNLLLSKYVFIFNTEDGKPVNHGAVSQGPGGCGVPDAPGVIFASIFAVMSLVNDILVRYQVKWKLKAD